MNCKQKLFVEEYLVDHNATQAAIRAGYSRNRKVAKVQAYRLLKRADVAVAVAKRQAEIARKLGITQESVRVELAKIAFANMLDYMQPGLDGDPHLDFSQLTRDQAAALIEVTVDDFKEGRGKDARDVRRIKFKLADKLAALVDLGRHLGMFKQVHEHSGMDGGPVIFKTIYEGK